MAQQAEKIEHDGEADASHDDQEDDGKMQSVIVHDEWIGHIAAEGGHAGITKTDDSVEEGIEKFFGGSSRERPFHALENEIGSDALNEEGNEENVEDHLK